MKDDYVIKQYSNQIRAGEVPIQNPLFRTASLVPRKPPFVTFSNDVQQRGISVRHEKCAPYHNGEIQNNSCAVQDNSRITTPDFKHNASRNMAVKLQPPVNSTLKQLMKTGLRGLTRIRKHVQK